ncbi:5-formyltetrahydrofolate cyclo-ligase [Oryzibacter oryziterrae]|uniref:5-formyltetrahydrofolate cyclo-ligase n=1 Tax=Oryzibacter oryziterrae TaxID=2766474 RepID=UPI001F02B41D|nr:5-formyltetrahydrofolate cyclo-ligase [Oryzibacter oryziterrae]
MAALKAHLRAEALSRRDALPEAERIAASAAIAERILALDLAPGAVVSAFLPIRSEVDLRPTITALSARGHAIGLPIMRKPDLVFRVWTPGADLVPLGFGTYGPGPEAAEVLPDVMLVPLSAFDRSCGRIGYGKAFYDLTIAGYHQNGRFPRLIGVAFSVQSVEEVPIEPHDVRLHMVITERDVVSPA